MNSEYTKQAMEKIGNANVLINLVSQRVRLLANGSQPLIDDAALLGLGDIALLEIIHDKVGYGMSQLPHEMEEPAPTFKKRRKA